MLPWKSLYRCLVSWLLYGPGFSMFYWMFWFDVLSKVQDLFYFFPCFSCLGYSSLDHIVIDNHAWVGNLEFMWVGLANKWVLCFFWYEICMAWSCQSLRQKFAEVKKISVFYVCMHENKRKIVFQPLHLCLIPLWPVQLDKSIKLVLLTSLIVSNWVLKMQVEPLFDPYLLLDPWSSIMFDRTWEIVNVCKWVISSVYFRIWLVIYLSW